MTTSALLRNGVDHMKTLLDGLIQWMDARNFGDIRGVHGLMNQRHIKDPTTFERINYIQILQAGGTAGFARKRM